MSLRTLVCISGALAALGACGDPNESGKVRATKLGAHSDVPAPRARYDELMVDACGTASAMPSSAALRAPYLQKLSADSGAVLWTSSAAEDYTLDVTLPGGERVGSFQSRVEPTTVLRGASQHVVDFAGLTPDTLYCYSLRGPEGAEFKVGGMRTAPAPGTGAAVSFVAFGDSGHGGDDQKAVFEQLKTVPFDLVLVTGDVAYPSGALESFEKNFFDIYRPILSSFPVFPAAGNHDYQAKDAAPYREVFALPENGGDAGRERWYSFDWGDVHFVTLDTQRMSEAQAEWLDADLAENQLPWTVVIAHKSPYASGSHGSNETFRRLFSPILEFHNVPLVLAGHDHNYERTHAIDGVTYVVTGGGGRGTRSVGKSSFTAFSHDVLHFVYVTIEGQELRLYAIDATGREFDFARIVKED